MSHEMTISEVYEIGNEFFHGGYLYVEVHDYGLRFVHESIVDGVSVSSSHVLERELKKIDASGIRGFLHASLKEPNYG